MIGLVLASILVVQDPALPPATEPWAEFRPFEELRARARDDTDWLIDDRSAKTEFYRGERTGEWILSNGLIARTWRVAPNAATVALDSLRTGESLLRGVKPEARIRVDGEDAVIGGLDGQPNYAYLTPGWLDALVANPTAFRFVDVAIGETRAPFEWQRKRWCEDRPWPAPGRRMSFRFKSTKEWRDSIDRPDLEGLTVTVHYEMYDGIPALAKWLTIENATAVPVRLDSFTSEILAVVEHDSYVEGSGKSVMTPPSLRVESDYAFGGMKHRSSNHTTHWLPDPQYQTQVHYRRLTPCLLESKPPAGPAIDLAPGESFDTFRTFELVFDSTERERRGLSVRKMYRTVAPWVTENPLMMHVRHSDDESVRRAIDQCAEVGFEMVILTFGSGFDLESDDPESLERWKRMADYAHEKGIEIGGYSLLSSRRIGPETDVIDPATGEPGGAKFGHAPCLGSEWGAEYFAKLYRFFEATGFDLLEHDGSYPGDFCGSPSHPGHRDHRDSQWRQWRVITDFYRWCRARGVYLNVPDFYYLSGSNKCGMGYRETNWSLPRAQQIVHGRQNIYDGTWEKTPSMGWMFVPLTEYHGGGPAATIEPLDEHLDAYESHLANNLGLGVQACYRGPRLYDTPRTKAVVKKWVDFYRRYRVILDSDLIHVRRADGRDLDAMLHVHPGASEVGLLMVYNPLDREVARTLEIPLYYTGLTTTAQVSEREGEPREYSLDREYRIELPVRVPARGRTWFIVR